METLWLLRGLYAYGRKQAITSAGHGHTHCMCIWHTDKVVVAVGLGRNPQSEVRDTPGIAALLAEDKREGERGRDDGKVFSLPFL